MSFGENNSSVGIRAGKLSFRATKIGTRLTIAFGILVALLMVSTFISLNRLGALNREVTRIVDNHLAALDEIQQLEAEVSSFDRSLSSLVTSTSDAAAFRELSKITLDAKKRGNSLVTRSAQESSSRAPLIEVFNARAGFLASVAKILEPLAQDDSVTAMAEFLEGFAAAKETYLARLEVFRGAEQAQIIESRQEAANSSATGARLVVAVNVILACLALLIGWVIARSVSRPLANAVNTANAIAAGDLMGRIDTIGRDEVAELMNAMSNMVGSLSNMVMEIRGSADAIMKEALDTAAGNSNLSHRTQQQAETLAQTAQTIDKFATTVTQNAQRAVHAKSLAADASNVAAEGGSAMQRAVESMGKVDASTKEIAQIIDIIEGIAFQTNILALNAAVEAARAGEHGRGFAVVAAEVRGLAQRAGGSAKEIRTLIRSSVDDIRTGRDLVGAAGSKIAAVITGFQNVTDIVNEIALASSAQTGDMRQVNQAITELDGVTKQNRTLVQRARTATVQLEEQARNLVGLMGRFRIDETSEAVDVGDFGKQLDASNPQSTAAIPRRNLTHST
jgi:methyl-accepting chemotaxis protein